MEREAKALGEEALRHPALFGIGRGLGGFRVDIEEVGARPRGTAGDLVGAEAVCELNEGGQRFVADGKE